MGFKVVGRKRKRRGVGKVAIVANSWQNFPASPAEKFGRWEKILHRTKFDFLKAFGLMQTFATIPEPPWFLLPTTFKPKFVIL